MKLNRIKIVLVEKDFLRNGLQSNLGKVSVLPMHIAVIDNNQIWKHFIKYHNYYLLK